MSAIPVLLMLSHTFLSLLHGRERLLNEHFIRYTYRSIRTMCQLRSYTPINGKGPTKGPPLTTYCLVCAAMIQVSLGTPVY